MVRIKFNINKMKIIYVYCVFFIAFLIGCEKTTFNLDVQSINEQIENAEEELYVGNYNESFKIYNSILSALEEDNSPKGKKTFIKVQNSIGLIFENLGQKKSAFDRYNEAFKTAQEINHSDYQIITLVNLAYLENEPLEIIKILSEVPDIANGTENLYTDQYKCRLAQAFIESDSLNKGLYIFDGLITKYTNDTTYKILDHFYKGRGIAYHNLEMYSKAIEDFETALNVLNTGFNEIEKVDVLIEKANSLFMLKNYNASKATLDLTKDFFDKSSDIVRRRKAKQLYLNIFQETKDLENQLKILNELRDLDNEKAKAQNEIQGSIFANFEISNLKRERELEASKSKLLYFLFGLSALTLFLYHLFYRNRTKVKLLKKEQKVKEEQAKHKDLQNKLEIESINAFVNGQEEERKRYAMQLHDSLGANLAAVNMHLSVLKKDVPGKSYNRVSKMLKNAIEETRSISHNIMPPVLVNQGLIVAITEKALEWECDNLQFDVDTTIERVPINDKLEITLYRGILECINNIIRHAHASKVHISFSHQQNSLQIAIKDNGQGFDVEKIKTGEGGLGINGLKLRIHYFEGDFKIQSKKGEGTMVNISVPLLAIKQTG